MFLSVKTAANQIKYKKTGLQLRVRIGKLVSLLFIKTYVVGTQKNRANETVLLSTHNTY